MSLSDAIAKMRLAVPSVHDTWNRMEPLEAAPDKAVPPVPPVPPENAKAETVFRLDAGQPGNDIEPANRREWDYQLGWWKGEDGPLWVEAWTPAGNKITVAANDQAHAERIRRDNPPPIGGRAPCP